MQQFSIPEWLFIPGFVALWLGICAALGLAGGWHSLAKNFRAVGPAPGERFHFVSGSMGRPLFPVSYGSCLFATVGESGFRLSLFFLFRPFSPPLFIPWSEVEWIESRSLFLFRYVVIRIRNHWPRVLIRGAAGASMQQAYMHSKGAAAGLPPK